MIKLELPTDPIVVNRINQYFQDYYVKLLTEMNTVHYHKNRLLDKVLAVCGNMENFKLLVTGEWNEIKRLPSIYGYFLTGKYYLELIEMKAKDDNGQKTISQRNKWIKRLNSARSKFRIMEILIDDLYATTSNFGTFQRENKKKFKKFEEWNKIFGEFLDYEDFRDRCRVNLWKDYNCQVCPYCNLKSLSHDEEFTEADIEHFYPKSTFALFSVSKFNLNPGCSICNSRLKCSRYFHYNPRYRTLDKGFQFSFHNNENVIDDYLKLNNNPEYTGITIESQFTWPADNMVKKAVRDLKILKVYNVDANKKLICRIIGNYFRYRNKSEELLREYGSDEKAFEHLFYFDKVNYANRKFMNEEKGKFKADIIDVLQKRLELSFIE